MRVRGKSHMSRSNLRIAFIYLSLAAASAVAQTPPTTTAESSPPAPRNDYSKPETWLCRPGQKDACAIDLATTVVSANGKMTREAFNANPKPPIDCFYVYPTVSLDTTGNSDMNAGAEELNVIR